ncbi:MAG: MFS transporter [Deltaproteobacteria bacterium]|nr:MFS transporter [Deltaproteobacteria bacterium]
MRSDVILKFAILLLALVPIETGNSIQPALAEISNALNIGNVLVGYILSLPALASIIFAVVCGRLSVAVSKKKLVITGLIFYVLGGAGAAIISNIYWILACRFVLGIGAGFVVPLIMGLITEFYEGHDKASMMGYSQAVSSFGGVVISLAAGYLAMINWRLNFLVSLIFIFVIVIVLKILPDKRPVIKNSAENPDKKGVLTPGVFVVALIGFSSFALAMNMMINIALFISDAGLGDAMSIGKAVSLSSFFSFPAALLFGRAFKLIRLHALTLAISLNIIVAILIANAQDILWIYAATSLSGISIGLSMPGYSIAVSELVPRSHHSYAFGLLNACMNLGAFVAPLLMPVFFDIAGAGNYRGFFIIITRLYALISVTTFIYIMIIKRGGTHRTQCALPGQ